MSDQILIINTGSTSIKYKLFGLNNLNLIKENYFENVKDYTDVLKNILREIGDLSDLKIIGHRVVHGGREFFKPVKIDQTVLNKLNELSYLAPLHNPYNLKGIQACLEFLPKVLNVAVFDTGFYKDLPLKSKVYGLPYDYYKKFGIQRFGFHGLSHEYVAQQAAEKLGKPYNKLKIISCHLGGGGSVTAIKDGQPVATSMGMTPLEGLLMMTRPGDIDSGVVLELLKIQHQSSPKKSVEELIDNLEELLNFKSGIKGLSDKDNYLELLQGVTFSEEKSKLAFDIFIQRIKKYIGAYFALLNGCDALVFTGAIGSGKPTTRQQVCKNMDFLNKTEVMVIETNEELQIARKVKDLVK
ncbi:MAG: acetate/propionate family kinase [Patescibacteria group bacterium]|nr:acetate/propionate family kinase [Patescibacteria group bacterium]